MTAAASTTTVGRETPEGAAAGAAPGTANVRPASATERAAGRYYRPELDVLRFIAFSFVFLDHVLPSGRDPRVAKLPAALVAIVDAVHESCAFGVSLFFALSAFLICELLMRELDAAGTVQVKQFYIRRILRIWPLYFLGLGLGMLAAVLPGGSVGDLRSLGWFVVFLGAWQIAIHGIVTNPASVLWSVSVEEQFYLIVPWVVKYMSRKLIAAFCLLVIAASTAWLVVLGRIAESDTRVWFDSLVHFECFAAGILLALGLRGRLPSFALWQRPIVFFLGWLCWFFSNYALHVRFRGQTNPGSVSLAGGYALAALGSVLMLVALLGTTAKLLPRWAVYLGRISYGLYVYHLFALAIAAVLFGRHVSFGGPAAAMKGGVALGLTIALAMISYRWFETPFLKMKKRHAIIDSQPVGR